MIFLEIHLRTAFNMKLYGDGGWQSSAYSMINRTFIQFALILIGCVSKPIFAKMISIYCFNGKWWTKIFSESVMNEFVCLFTFVNWLISWLVSCLSISVHFSIAPFMEHLLSFTVAHSFIPFMRYDAIILRYRWKYLIEAYVYVCMMCTRTSLWIVDKKKKNNN